MDSENSEFDTNSSSNDEMDMPNPLENDNMYDFPMPPNHIPVVNNINYSNFQDNYNQFYQSLPLDKTFSFKCLPLIFYNKYDDVSFLENSNKIILPKEVLYDLSKYDNIKYPMRFKINDSNIVFSVHDFLEGIDSIYMPNDLINAFDLKDDIECKLELYNEDVDTGTKIVLKPHTSNFLEIEDHKSVLENHLMKAYDTIVEGQTISIPYFDTKICIDVIKCEPSITISLIDTDLVVDFEQPYDYVEPPPRPKTPEIVVPRHEPKKESKGFVPFSGKGYRLGDS